MADKLVESDLDGFTGTERYTRHWTGKLVYTDGIAFLAEKGGAHWLIDIIASYQIDPKVVKNRQLQEFQLWVLRAKDSKAIITCQEDSDKPAVITQRIGFTDFPLHEVKLYVENGVLLLPGEH
jgi:hypothetical protein